MIPYNQIEKLDESLRLEANDANLNLVNEPNTLAFRYISEGQKRLCIISSAEELPEFIDVYLRSDNTKTHKVEARRYIPVDHSSSYIK